MINRNRKLWIAGCLALVCIVPSLGGCDSSSIPDGGKTSVVERPAKSASSEWASIAQNAIERNKLTSLAEACIRLEVDDQVAGSPVDITATEVHNASCGGDPNTEPRLFSLRIDRQTKAISSDALSEDGEFLSLK